MRIAIITKIIIIFTLTIIIGLGIYFAVYLIEIKSTEVKEFNAQRAYEDMAYQVGLGPRTMGSVAHEQVADWMASELKKQHWVVETQETVISGVAIKNIIAKRGHGTPWILIGSHYDSRFIADRDPIRANPMKAVPGANDGASTVAILMELGRVLPLKIDQQIWLVFFDDEDNGNATGSGWSIGSQYFVSQLQEKPDSVVVLDMLGDKDLNIYMEANSNRQLNSQIWSVAAELGYAQFIPKYKYSMIDDHTPFLEAGIKATDVIDFDYPYWHTTNDTLDKISANSLKIVGDTMIKWLEQYTFSTGQ
jgi:glutaminyl-peptide cyclotransferase